MGTVRTIREAKSSQLLLRLVEKDAVFIGLAFAADGTRKVKIDGEAADDVWRRLHDEAGKADPRYFGFDGARARFLRFFPEGFHSPGYVEHERKYKLEAKSKLERAVPVEAAVHGSGFGEAVLGVFQRAKLLSTFELIRIRNLLRERAADAFIRAAARFALGELKPALIEMERALRPYGCASWAAATYLPFLWRPDIHMFLKPEVTKNFATRVGHRFASDYQSGLDVTVYESLLDLAEETLRELKQLRPRDLIDVQSFIWVVSVYEDEWVAQTVSS